MPSIIEQFKGRQHTPLVQFIKYGIAGVIATGVDVVLFQICALYLFPALKQTDPVVRLLHLNVTALPDVIRGRNAMIDTGITFIFSNMVAYLMNIYWVFESGRHNRWVEIGSFYLVSGISTVIGVVAVGVLIDHFKVETNNAYGVKIIISVMLNYVLRKFLIFKK